MGNHGTSANSSSNAESSWCLNEMTEGAVTIEVGSLFQYFTTRSKKDDFLPRRLGRIKKGLGSRSNPPDNILYAEATSVLGV